MMGNAHLLHIGICDDDTTIRERVRTICIKLLQEREIQAEICMFPNAQSVLQDNRRMDILFLDIEMPDMDGIELKNLLQSECDERIIIYLTNHSEFINEAFGIHVFGFVKKWEMEEKLPLFLVSAVKLWGRFVLIDGRISSRDVLYIKTEHIYSRLWLKDGTDELVRSSSKELETALAGADFIRISRSTLVNMREIRFLKDGKVQLSNMELSISVRFRKQAEQKYDAFCRRNARCC